MEFIPGDYQFNAINSGSPVQRFWHGAKLRLLDRLQIADEGQTALDAGCGSGVVSNYLSEHCSKVIGIDMSQAAIDFASSQFCSSKLSFMKFELQSVSSIGRFDLIVCFEVLEHLEPGEVQAVLNEFYLSANFGAKLCITVPNSRSLWPLIEWLLDRFHLVPKLKGEQHLSQFNKNNLEAMLGTSGWKVEHIAIFNGVAPFLALFSAKLAECVERFEFRAGRFTPLNLIQCVAIKEI